MKENTMQGRRGHIQTRLLVVFFSLECSPVIWLLFFSGRTEEERAWLVF